MAVIDFWELMEERAKNKRENENEYVRLFERYTLFDRVELASFVVLYLQFYLLSVVGIEDTYPILLSMVCGATTIYAVYKKEKIIKEVAKKLKNEFGE